MLIGLVGFIGSGKGTVAEYLAQYYGFTSDSFAAPLKDAVALIFGWKRNLLEGDTVESRRFREQVDPFWSEKLNRPNFTPRLALQLFGTEAGRRVFGSDIWIASLEKRIARDSDTVITDVRFRNEINLIKSKGGYLVAVFRGEKPEWYELAAEVQKDGPVEHLPTPYETIHASEFEWIGSKFDFEIHNDSDLQNLHSSVRLMVDEFEESLII